VGISRDYPLKTRTSKQPIGEIPGCEIIPSHPLKYPRSKQGLKVAAGSTLASCGGYQNARAAASGGKDGVNPTAGGGCHACVSALGARVQRGDNI
jgi:hypothetical protein